MINKCLGIIILSLALVVGCANQSDTNAQNKNEIKESKQIEKTDILLSAIDMDTGEQKGNEILDKDYNFLILWQPDCEFCEIDLKAIENIYKNYDKANFIGLGVGEVANLKNKQQEWGSTIKTYKISDEFLQKIMSMGVKTTPTTLVVDKNGKQIKDAIVGIDDSSSRVEDYTKTLKTTLDKIIK